MARFEFQDLGFNEIKDKIRVSFLRMFYFDIDKKELDKIGKFSIGKNFIEFDVSEKKANKKFNYLLEDGFNNLKNKLNNKKTVYIHQNSGIPLIGYVAFGLVDRGTNLIEVKPVTSCNLKCIYCSVDDSKREVDFVIEEEYLALEFAKLVKFKGDGIDAHIASQGEPLLYEPIVDLVKDISLVKGVKNISIDTNGLLLDEKKIDLLVEAGLTQVNLSIDAIDENIAKELAGKSYDVSKIKKIASYLADKVDLVLTPILVPGINDDEIPKIIEFSKKIKCRVGIQNFLSYKFGRNPVKGIGMDEFYSKLQKWEKDSGVKLILSEKDFNISKTKELEKPFKKGEIVKATIVSSGRLPNEKLAIAKGRIIAIPSCNKEGKVNVKITRTKHNIFIGEIV